MSGYERHYFGLWPPITASSMRITVHEWNDQPCMSLLMMAVTIVMVCNDDDVMLFVISLSYTTLAVTMMYRHSIILVMLCSYSN